MTIERPIGLRFCGFEAVSAWALRATFEIRDAAGHEFTAWAEVRPNGTVADLQASDCTHFNSTGRREIDELISRRVGEELVRARSAAVVMDFDRRRSRSRSA